MFYADLLSNPAVNVFSKGKLSRVIPSRRHQLLLAFRDTN